MVHWVRLRQAQPPSRVDEEQATRGSAEEWLVLKLAIFPFPGLLSVCWRIVVLWWAVER